MPSQATITRLGMPASCRANRARVALSGSSSTSKIAPSSMPSSLAREKERRAFPDLALGPDAAFVARRDALGGRQADPGAGKLRGLVQSRERSEEFAAQSHVESDAVVAHEINRLGCAAQDAELDNGVLL